MRFTLTDKAALHRALVSAKRIANPRAGKHMPVLGAVRLEVAETVTVVANDLEVMLEQTLEGATLERTGVCVVDAKAFAAAIRALPKAQPVTIDADAETQRVYVKSGGADIMLPTFAEADTPALPEVEALDLAEVDAAALARLAGVVYAASTDETRYNLNGVQFETETNGGATSLLAIATDGHRMAQRWATVVELGELAPIDAKGRILSRLAIGALLRALGKAPSGTVAWRDTPSLTEWKARTWRIVTRNIDGEFPRWRQVMPKGGDAWQIDRDELAGAIAETRVCAPERSQALRVTLNGSAIVEAETPDTGKASREIDAAGPEGAEVTFGVNASYLADALAAHPDAGVVTLAITDELSPIALRTFDGRGIDVVMPMRL